MPRADAVKVAGVRERVAAAGIFHLPPDSPDPDPIGQMSAKPKALLRNAAARTRATLWTAIGNPIGTCSPDECRN